MQNISLQTANCRIQQTIGCIIITEQIYTCNVGNQNVHEEYLVRTHFGILTYGLDPKLDSQSIHKLLDDSGEKENYSKGDVLIGSSCVKT